MSTDSSSTVRASESRTVASSRSSLTSRPRKSGEAGRWLPVVMGRRVDGREASEEGAGVEGGRKMSSSGYTAGQRTGLEGGEVRDGDRAGLVEQGNGRASRRRTTHKQAGVKPTSSGPKTPGDDGRSAQQEGPFEEDERGVRKRGLAGCGRDGPRAFTPVERAESAVVARKEPKPEQEEKRCGYREGRRTCERTRRRSREARAGAREQKGGFKSMRESW